MNKQRVICRLKVQKNTFDVKTTGDWSTDNMLGSETADLIIQEMTRTGNPTLLGQAVRGLTRSGEYNGIHAGFFNRFSERVIVGY